MIVTIEICDLCNTNGSTKGSNLCIECQNNLDERIINE